MLIAHSVGFHLKPKPESEAKISKDVGAGNEEILFHIRCEFILKNG